MKTLNFCRYSDHFFSIKDENGVINISDSKWDFLFKMLIANSNSVLFDGFRLNYAVSDLAVKVQQFSEGVLINKDDHFCTLFKVGTNHLNYDRLLFEKFWKLYEYPGLIFLQDEMQENKLLNLYTDGIPRTDIFSLVNKVCVVYTEIEEDVLWIKISADWESVSNGFPDFLQQNIDFLNANI